MNRPTPISAFSDQRRTKSTTRSRTSCGTQIPVRVPQDFFLARCAQPSAQPGPRPWSAPSSPRTRSVSASPPLGGGDAETDRVLGEEGADQERGPGWADGKSTRLNPSHTVSPYTVFCCKK